MEKAIIFGCGTMGDGTFCKLKGYYDVVAWTDNNSNLWGKKKNEIDIIAPNEIPHLIINQKCVLFVAVVDSKDIISQLHAMNIYDFYAWKHGFIFYNEKRGFWTNKNKNRSIGLKHNSVLFVLNAIIGGIREYRLAQVLKMYGYTIYLAYFTPEEAARETGFTDVYEDIIPLMSLEDLMDLVNNNTFEFVHSSSEPEWLTAFLLNSNKKILHECHDLGSANVNMFPERLVSEFVSNVGAKGVFYPTELLREEAVRKFGLDKKKTFVVENLISESLAPLQYLNKLSKEDGKIHAVYEGAITSTDELDKRYFEKIWLRIANAGVVIHFYTNHRRDYCEYLDRLHNNIHYEGNVSSKTLATEMTKYDVGLLVFNVNRRNKKYLESASPNKMYEYLNAGIPVVTYGIDVYKEFVERKNVGGEIDLENDIYQRFQEIAQIRVDSNFLKDNRLTIESNKDRIVEFINSVVREDCDEE